jgi:protein-arginine kinase activator protein McsA
MPEISIKIEMEVLEISSYNMLSEDTSCCPNQGQIELKLENVTECWKAERRQAQPNRLTCSSCNVMFEEIADFSEHALIHQGDSLLFHETENAAANGEMNQSP